MKPTTIFITYNPNIDDEQTLAVRLHTIGAVNGFKMYLPDRYNSETYLVNETKLRIDEADFVVLFSLQSKLSNIVKQEIEYAWERLRDKSKIIVIYPSKKTLISTMTEHFTEIYFNPHKDTVDSVTNTILNTIFQKVQNQQKTELKENQLKKQKQEEIKQEQTNNGILALISIGLALVILNKVMKK